MKYSYFGEEKPRGKFFHEELGQYEKLQWERIKSIPDGMRLGAIESDRLRQRDWDKYDELCIKHFGDDGHFFFKRTPEKIEAFLSDYLEEGPVILLYIVQGENLSSGHWLWTFGYACKAKEKA